MTATLSAVIAAVLTLLLLPIVHRYVSRRGLIDRPGPRRSHDRPVARGGGVALALGLLAALMLIGAGGAAGSEHVVIWVVLTVGIAVVALLGAWDDHRPLPVRVRLPVQLAVASVSVAAVGGVPSISLNGVEVAVPLLWSLLAVPAVVWMMNLFNFMDGSDGLAALEALAAGLLMAWAFDRAGAALPAATAAALAAASAAFLVWNRPPARIFLGDSGSLTLGFVLGALALIGSAAGHLSVWAAFIAVSPFVVDATATLVWRSVRGARWYTPHREHAYQCLIRSGWTHRRVLIALAGLNVLVVAPAFVVAVVRPDREGWVALTTGVFLLAVWFLARQRAQAEREDE
ncbi:glycosyl transferase [Wenzhouxiangella sp. XN79A]|uniref:glycosyl transferase n=1 Tax=Wenzhouxiangella sp. XN79A TaxID=2724193 RepID=UPI00144AF198|nr:glycosyl transferase [Wenzhouxiangella sp. XN79A]NKI35527.1 glycosyl transferase [Wenzhouxiangella sp. XN79A]